MSTFFNRPQVFIIQSMVYLLIAVNMPRLFLYFSIGLYGIVAWSIPSIMAALVTDYVGPHRTFSVFGFITFIFGLGQIAGPYLSGILAALLSAALPGENSVPQTAGVTPAK